MLTSSGLSTASREAAKATLKTRSSVEVNAATEVPGYARTTARSNLAFERMRGVGRGEGLGVGVCVGNSVGEGVGRGAGSGVGAPEVSAVGTKEGIAEQLAKRDSIKNTIEGSET